MQLQQKPSPSSWSYKGLQFILFCVPKIVSFQILVRIPKKLVSFDDIVHFPDAENIVAYVYFDCRITLYPETPTKIRQIKRDWKYFSRSCEKSQCIPSNFQQNWFFDEQHSSNIFLIPYNFWNMIPAALTSLNHTNDRYSMSNLYLQPTTHLPRTDWTPVFPSLRTMDNESKDCASALLSFIRNYLPDGRVKEKIATVEKWSDHWKPGAMNGIPLFVMNGNCF